MKVDYERELIPNPSFKPYFDWKFYGTPIKSLTRQTYYEIMKEAQRELEALDAKHLKAHEQVLVEPTPTGRGMSTVQRIKREFEKEISQ